MLPTTSLELAHYSGAPRVRDRPQQLLHDVRMVSKWFLPVPLYYLSKVVQIYVAWNEGFQEHDLCQQRKKTCIAYTIFVPLKCSWVKLLVLVADAKSEFQKYVQSHPYEASAFRV